MIQNYPELKGKTAIITGASGNIGKGISRVLGAQGMHLILVGRSQDAGSAFENELTSQGISAKWITADLVKWEEAERVLDSFSEDPYLLVNNAAILLSKPVLDFDENEFNISLVDNLKILHHITYLSINRMEKSNKGVVINISSVGGQRAHRGLCGYDSYKGAMDSFTRSASLDLASHGIRVNGIAPGAIGTRVDETKKEGIPLGRLGTEEEIGLTAAFLASDGAAYITGQTITVDGGLTAQLTPPGIFI